MDVEFAMGSDFGYGFTVFVDGDIIRSKAGNTFWNYDWAHQVISVKFEARKDISGHNVVVYGSEDCCDGDMNIKFNG
jgi:hypothetical protein